jgi:hypothetical protein
VPGMGTKARYTLCCVTAGTGTRNKTVSGLCDLKTLRPSSVLKLRSEKETF